LLKGVAYMEGQEVLGVRRHHSDARHRLRRHLPPLVRNKQEDMADGARQDRCHRGR
jgi:hypothetical protein